MRTICAFCLALLVWDAFAQSVDARSPPKDDEISTVGFDRTGTHEPAADPLARIADSNPAPVAPETVDVPPAAPASKRRVSSIETATSIAQPKAGQAAIGVIEPAAPARPEKLAEPVPSESEVAPAVSAPAALQPKAEPSTTRPVNPTPVSQENPTKSVSKAIQAVVAPKPTASATAVSNAETGTAPGASATPVKPVAPPKPPPPPLTTIRGQLALTTGGRPLRPQEAVDAVVYFRSSISMPVVAPQQPYVMLTERKAFMPRVLPVPVGATVRFPNNDPILHNVFSTAKEANFDLGLYGRGDGESHTFTQAGVIRVFCNVHHAMVAHVLVMDTPYFVKPDAQGRFRLSNVPEGSGELFVWHERSQLWRRAYVAGKDGDVTVPLELSKRKIPPHLNKFGQPYRRSRPDEY